MARPGHLLNLGAVPYREAWDLQRSISAAVLRGEAPDTVLLLEHPPVITLGRRAEEGELHVPDGAEVEIVETDRGGKSTYHGPGQLVCYPIFDLTRHGQDVKKYCRDLEEALIRTLSAVGVERDAHRRSDRDLARAPAAQDRLHRRPHLEVGDDARVCAQRRSRPGAVHRVDHGLRPGRHGLHDRRARAGAAGHRRRAAPARRSRTRRGLRALRLTEPRLSGLEQLRVLDGRDERVDDHRVELRS